jgi:hypothetical protein
VSLVREERPMIFFGAIALLFAVVSVLLMVPIIHHYIEYNDVPRLPTAMLSLGLMLVAVVSLFSGLILDTVTRGRWELKRLSYLSIQGPQGLKKP